MPEEESALVAARRAKLERLRERGVEPYPWEFPGRVPSSVVVAACGGIAPGGSDPARRFRVAGRLKIVRTHGRSSFLDLIDLEGSVQLLARVDELGEAGYRALLDDLDPGDLIGAEGFATVTRRGEPSLTVASVVLLAKALSPPPEKYHGLVDAETRIRDRHVDLLASAETRRRFQVRSLLTRELRYAFESEGFLEVETSVLSATASGAAATPFTTRSRYLDRELSLRIALEIPLKRLLIGGLERVYEIGHVFRNEDLDSVHSPEFTMLEAYWAYADYTDMQRLTERLYERLARRAAELLPEVPAAAEAPELFRPPFRRIDFVEELEAMSGLTGLLDRSREELRELARKVGATVPESSPAGKYLDKLFEHYVEPTLDRPTFVLDHPVATTPLAKRHRSRAGRVERFELYCRGTELGNCYTELNDPEEQGRRFREQVGGRLDDHYATDDEFVRALRYGMPPATGIGIGVDRLVMALTGVASIKDVILFLPTRERSAGSELGA
jgi:lysyl-tRNA synthetase, class II